jgi:hypothetical protein
MAGSVDTTNLGASPPRLRCSGDRAFRGSAIAPAPPAAWLLRTPPIPCAGTVGEVVGKGIESKESMCRIKNRL